MTRAPLKVLTEVALDALPVVGALHRLHRDVGSVKARLVLPDVDPPPPDDQRLICVGCTDAEDVEKLRRDLGRELAGDLDAVELASTVAIVEMNDGLRVVVFLALSGVSVEGIGR